MKIAIIGAGNVGRTLGEGWTKRGHEIVYGTREPVNSVRDAVQSSDVVVIAVSWKAVPEALRAAGDLKGKVVLDPTVPLLPDFSGLDTSVQPSGGETVAALIPGAKVVKIFNTTGNNNMANPDYHGEKATMFYCGDDAVAKQLAASLAGDLGFEPVDAGGLNQSHVLETLGLFWVSLVYKQGLGREIAFKLMRR
jgi:predicted dinucleotide-binding enzyme